MTSKKSITDEKAKFEQVISKYLASSVPYTEDQKKAIELKGDILVSASAGSGKTAVLVERIITGLLKKEISIDRLLVVTFTEAAAAQMKRKINDTINDKIKKISYLLNGQNDIDESERDILNDIRSYLKQQTKFIFTADIMTIDAFCLKVVRSNFHLLGIDPGFSIQDEALGSITMDNVISDMTDMLYEQEDKDFIEMAGVFAPAYNEKTLADAVKYIFNFSRAFPYPDKWLDSCAKMYDKPFEKTIWYKQLKRKINYIIENHLEKLEELIRKLVTGKDAVKKIIADKRDDELLNSVCNGYIWQALVQDYEYIDGMKKYSWDMLYDALNGENGFYAFKAGMKNKIDSEEYKELYDNFSKNINEIIKSFKSSLSSVVDVRFEYKSEAMKRAGKTVGQLVKTVKVFAGLYAERKADMKVMTFSDIELECLRLFDEFEDVRRLYAEKYDEILIDEYQDTNSLQETIFHKISSDSGGANIFMVGDMKQSIYRFRNSDPSIFKEKSDMFSYSTVDKYRVLLARNFRSRHNVLSSVNDIFNDVMTLRDGELEYREEQLQYDVVQNNGYKDHNGDKCGGYKSELYIIEKQAESNGAGSEETDNIRMEAKFAAKKINELVSSGFMVQDKDGPRKIKYSDIVILANSVSSISEIYSEELKNAGIGVTAEKKDFYARDEIAFMLDMLKITDNPVQDIPFISVMLSPIGGFDEDDLVRLRLEGKENMFMNMTAVLKNTDGAEDAFTRKCRVLVQRLEKYRFQARILSIERLLWYIYTDSKIYDLFGVTDTSGGAQANLRLLFEKAKTFSSGGFKSLFDFVRYTERSVKQGIKAESAGAAADMNTVKMMTIHKSKGLEFPVVILAAAGKQFNTRPLSISTVLAHKDAGIGIDCYNRENMSQISSPSKEAVRDVMYSELIAEEMRKLYVALTRAKEKLIVLCSLNKKPKMAVKKDKFVLAEGVKGFYSWLIPKALNSDNWKVSEESSFSDMDKIDAQTEVDVNETADEELKRSVDEILSFVYKYSYCRSIPSKISVTSLKEKAVLEEEDADYIMDHDEHRDTVSLGIASKPNFLKKDNVLSGAQLGTVYHKVLASIDIRRYEDIIEVTEALDKLKSAGVLEENERSSIDDKKLFGFFCSDIAKRMEKADKTAREVPFEIDIPVSAYDPSLKGEKQQLLLQGIIDCYFEENGKIILLDYKSDYYSDESSRRQLEHKYSVQLNWYKYAIEHILNKRVSETYLFFLHKGELARIYLD